MKAPNLFLTNSEEIREKQRVQMSRSKSKGIVAWPEGERPRERLLRLGSHSLTDAELVAILLRVGVQGTSAVELARQILKKFSLAPSFGRGTIVGSSRSQRIERREGCAIVCRNGDCPASVTPGRTKGHYPEKHPYSGRLPSISIAGTF